MPQHKFKVKLIGEPGKSTAALKPPFDVVEVFHTKARVPVKGTINGFPFRSSLMNMGTGHMMAVNAQLRAGANCKGGDTVDIVMELDQDDRVRDFSADEQALAQHLGNQIGAALRLLGQRTVQEQLFRTEKLAAVGRLISGVVSELQTPLNSINELASRALEREKLGVEVVLDSFARFIIGPQVVAE